MNKRTKKWSTGQSTESEHQLALLPKISCVRHDMKYHKRKRKPKYTKAQLENFRLLSNFAIKISFKSKIIVIDGAKYFTKGNTLVRGQALNPERYVEQCLPKLIHFVQRFHTKNDIIFFSCVKK